MSTFESSIARLIRVASLGAVVILGLRVSPGMVAALSGHGDLERVVSAIWSMAAPLHLARNWLPGFGTARGPIGLLTSAHRSGPRSAA